MPRALLLLAVAVLSVGFAPAPPPKRNLTKEDQEKMQGEWVAVQAFTGGRQVPETEVAPITISGDRFRFHRGDEYVMALSAKQAPKAIDLRKAAGDCKGRSCRGIYRLEADTLTLCIPNDEAGERPTVFGSTNPDFITAVFTRKKQ